MAVFRIEKKQDYIVMAKYHLRDRSISLKSKGLLTMMLSLPEEWNYSTRGLASICMEGVESIGTALKELEKAGYIVRNKLRDEKGRIVDTEYVIYEQPHKEPDADKPKASIPDTNKLDTDKPDTDKPDTDNPDTGFPYTVKPEAEAPHTDVPDTEKCAQLINNITNDSKELNIDGLNINQINQSVPLASARITAGQTKEKEIDGIDRINAYREIIHDNIDYDCLCVDYPHSVESIDEMVEIILEAVCTRKKTVRVGGDEWPAETVKSRLLKLNMFHVQYVLEVLRKNTTKVYNIKSYLLTTLYNAPATMSNYYNAEVNHDMRGDNE